MKHVKILESPEFVNILGRNRMTDYNKWVNRSRLR